MFCSNIAIQSHLQSLNMLISCITHHKIKYLLQKSPIDFVYLFSLQIYQFVQENTFFSIFVLFVIQIKIHKLTLDLRRQISIQMSTAKNITKVYAILIVKYQQQLILIRLCSVVNDLSKLLNTSKIFWMLNALDDAIAIFYMSGVIFDSRVEDVRKAVLPHKYMRQDADTLKDRMRTIRYTPHLLQIVYRVHFPFMLLDMQKQIAHCQLASVENWLYSVMMFLNILLNIAQNGLSIVFRNILCLILIVNQLILSFFLFHAFDHISPVLIVNF